MVDINKKDGLTCEDFWRWNRICRVWKVQDAYEKHVERSKQTGLSVEEELKSAGFSDYATFVDTCPEVEHFRLGCAPMELKEIGSGFVIYFYFIRFMMLVLLVLLAFQIYPLYYYGESDMMTDWNWNSRGFTTEDIEACKCLGDNAGVQSLNPNGNRSDPRYGTSCRAWDEEACQSGIGPPVGDGTSLPVGKWCCRSWCFASSRCPVTMNLNAKSLSNRRLPPGYGLPEDKILVKSYVTCEHESAPMSKCASGPMAPDVPFAEHSFKSGRMIPKHALTPGSLGPGRGDAWNPLMCYVLAVVVVGVLVVLMSQVILIVDQQCEAGAIHPSEWSVMVEGMPTTATDEEVIASWFKQHALRDRDDVEIVKVVIAWDGQEHKSKKNRLHAIGSQLKAVKAKNPEQASLLEQEAEKLKKDLWSAAPGGGDVRIASSGSCVVVFRQRADAEACFERWDNLRARWLYKERQGSNPLNATALPLFDDQNGAGPVKLRIRQAENPSNINWEDVGISATSRFWLNKRTKLANLCMIGVAFAIVYGFSMLGEDVKGKYFNRSTGQWEHKSSAPLAILPATGVSLVNILAMMVGRAGGTRECHLTKTEETASQMWNMSTATIICTAVVSLCIQSHPRDWYEKGGLVEDMYWMLGINAICPPLMVLLDYELLIRKRKRSRLTEDKLEKINEALSKGRFSHDEREKYERVKATRQVHEWEIDFEPTEMDTPYHYANALKTFLCSTVYTPLVPMACLIGFAGLTIQYAVDKYMLLRYCRRPSVAQNSALATSALHYVRFGVLLGLPIALKVFLGPSWNSDTLVDSAMWLSFLIAAFFCFLPLSILRILLCTAWLRCWLGAGDTLHDHHSTTDYYKAQYVWPKENKYHKSQFLYKSLPESMNPENLKPSDARLRASELKKHCGAALENSLETQAGHQVVLGHRNVQMPAQPSHLSDARTLEDGHGAQVIGRPTTEPTLVNPQWEYEWQDAYHAFDDDCQAWMEKMYNEWKNGGGNKRVKAQHKGKEVSVDFEKFTSYVKGSGVRAVRRKIVHGVC